MKYFLISLSLFLFLFQGYFIRAQQKEYTTANAHSHNDYLNDLPFYNAYKNGFGSIEADIFPVDGVLCVAHTKNEIQSRRTLKSLYLDPLLDKLKSNNFRKLKLLIDIKENYKPCLDLLLKELELLQPYLTTAQENKQLIILISGKRPPPSEYKNYPDYIYFDSDLSSQHNATEWERIGLVSLPFTKYSGWKGENEIAVSDKKIIKKIVDSVHSLGKTIRFWAAPDNEASWKTQMKLGVDLIGTDKIDELAIFLRKFSDK